MAIDVSASGTTPEQVAIAATCVVALFAFLVIYHRRLQFSGLDDREERVVTLVGRQLRVRRPGTVRLDPGDDLDARRDDVRRAFATSGAVDRTRSVAEAVDEVSGQVAEALRPYVGWVPPSARRFAGLAVLVAIFGALAVSHEAILRALTYESGPIDWATYLGLALSESAAVLQQLLAWIGSVPYVGTLLTFAWAYSILLADWTYRHWWVFALAFGAVAARLALLYRDRDPGPEAVSIDLPAPGTVARRLFGAGCVSWAAVLLAIGIGREVSTAKVGVTAGAGVLGAVLAFWASIALVRAVRWTRRVVGAYRQATRAGRRWAFVVRVGGLALAVAIGPILPIWIAVGLTHVPDLVSAWIASSMEVKLLSLLPVGVATVGVGVLLVRATGDVRAALAETVSRGSLQAAVFARGLPVALVVLAYLLLLGIGLGAPVAAIAAVVVGALARLAWTAYVRVRDRVTIVPDVDESARRVLVHCYELDLDDGRYYFARVNSHTVAEPTEQAAVDAILAVARGEFDPDPTPPTLAMHNADRLREDGWTNPDRVHNEVKSQARRTIEGMTFRERTLDPEASRERYAEKIPPETWRAEVAAVQHGRQRVVERDGKLIPA